MAAEREAQTQIYADIKDLSPDEEIAYFRSNYSP